MFDAELALQVGDRNTTEENLRSPLGIDMRRPSDRERVHAVFVAQDVRSVKAVLAAGARQDAIVLSIAAAVLIKQIAQAAFALIPVDVRVFFLGEPAGVANA